MNSIEIGHYVIIEELGRGGFGTVYRAQDNRIDREVALKVLSGRVTEDEQFVQRFRQEATVAASLNHPRIVTVYDFGEGAGHLYLVMRLIRGRTLRDILDEKGKLSLDEALPILWQLAEVLDYLSELNLIHRDVKPGNIMLEGHGQGLHVTLTDFGLVYNGDISTSVTPSGSIMGTPAYLAPEQIDSRQWGKVSPLTDLYALGVVAYEMVCGRVPFDGSFLEIINAHANYSPPSPLTHDPSLGAELTEVLLRGLAKRRSERFPRARDFVQALQSVADRYRPMFLQGKALDELHGEIQAHIQAAQWIEAIEKCTLILRVYPDHEDTQQFLNHASEQYARQTERITRERYIQQQYESALTVWEKQDWEQAVTMLRDLREQAPHHEGVRNRLYLAELEYHLEQQYKKALACQDEKHWDQSARVWLGILQQRNDYMGGEALRHFMDTVQHLLQRYDELVLLFRRQHQDLNRALAKIAHIEQLEEALYLYEELVTAVNQEDYFAAAALGEKLMQLAPELNYPQLWLAQTKKEREPYERADENGLQWERDGKEMTRIPAGPFFYSPSNKIVNLPEFWIDKTPVTNAEFKRFITANPNHPVPYSDNPAAATYSWDRTTRTYPDGLDHCPVVLISWHDATTYAAWAGKRLPTEEEWEKAARGTEGWLYPWGDFPPTADYCNFNNQENGPTPVGRYSPHGDSPFGCLDMSGNVAEWVVSSLSRIGRTLRGGSYQRNAQQISTVARFSSTLSYAPDIRYEDVGFRCVLDLPPKTDTHDQHP